MRRFAPGFVLCLLAPWAHAGGTTERDAAELYARGLESATAGRLDDAIAYFQSALALVPEPDNGEIVLREEHTSVTRPSGRGLEIEDRVSRDVIEYRPARRLIAAQNDQLTRYRAANPPALELSWLALMEPSGNNALDAGETGEMVLKVRNAGKSAALDVVIENLLGLPAWASVTESPRLAVINSNEERTVKVPVRVDPTVADGVVDLKFQATESGGFDSNVLEVEVATRALRLPELVIVDAHLEDASMDGRLTPSESVVATLRVENRGAGPATGVNVRALLGEGLFVAPDNKSDTELATIWPGESREVSFTFIAGRKLVYGQRLDLALEAQSSEHAALATKALSIPVYIPPLRVARVQVAPVERVVLASLDAVDVDVAVPAGRSLRPDAVAVVIGNRDYEVLGVPRVDYAINDARVMKAYLIKTLGFDLRNIIYIENATVAKFNETFGSAASPRGRLHGYVKPGVSEVFVFYSGHGAPELQSRGAVFVPTDSDPNYIGTSGYPLSTLYRNLEALPVPRVIVVIDACFSGNSPGGFLLSKVSPISVEPRHNLPKSDRVTVFSSATSSQLSAWYPEKRHGLFTYFFLKGLGGDADRDRNGVVTTSELGAFVSDRVPYLALRLFGHEQTPTLSELGEVPLAEFLRVAEQ